MGSAIVAWTFRDIHATFPDFKQEVVDIVAVGDSVVVREKMSDTHNGVGRIPVDGGMLAGVFLIGARCEIDAIYGYKVKDGKIADHCAVRDDLRMTQDYGLSAKPAAFDCGFRRQAYA